MSNGISIGRLRYDIVSDTTEFNRSMRVTRAQIKQVDQAFRDHSAASSKTRHELERLQDTMRRSGQPTQQMIQQEAVLTARLQEELRLENQVAEARQRAGMAARKTAQEIALEAKSVDKLEQELRDLERQNRMTFNARGGSIGGTLGGNVLSMMGFGGVGGAAGRLAGTGIGGFMTSGLAMGGAAAGASLLATFTKSVVTWAKLERDIVDLSSIIGDPVESKSLVSSLRRLAKQTPLTTSTLIKGVKTLRSYGIVMKNEAEMMRRFGDISGGIPEKMNSLIIAFSQVNAAGKLMGQEMLQLINAGFPVAEIAKTAGVSMADFRKEMEAGNITAQHLTDTIIRLTDSGGMFAGRMEAASKTLSGSWSRMWAEMEEAMADLGEDLAEGGWISTAMVTFGETIGGVIKSVGILIDAFKRLKYEISVTMSALQSAELKQDIAKRKARGKRIEEAAALGKSLGIDTTALDEAAKSHETGLDLGGIKDGYLSPKGQAEIDKQIEWIEGLKAMADAQNDLAAAEADAAKKSEKSKPDAKATERFQNEFQSLIEQATMVGMNDEERRRFQIEMQKQRDIELLGMTQANLLESARLELLEKELAYARELEEAKAKEKEWEEEMKRVQEDRIDKLRDEADIAKEKAKADADAARDKLKKKKTFAGAVGGSSAGADYKFLAQRQQHSIQNKLDRARNKKLDKIAKTLEDRNKKIDEDTKAAIKIIQRGD